MNVGDAGLRVQDHPILGPFPDVPLITFSFDGTDIQARDGEPIAAALLAAGVRVFRTMPRSGEERGGYCMVGRCSDCLMTVDGLLNMRACMTPVRERMRVKTQQGLGSWDETGSQSAAGEVS